MYIPQIGFHPGSLPAFGADFPTTYSHCLDVEFIDCVGLFYYPSKFHLGILPTFDANFPTKYFQRLDFEWVFYFTIPVNFI